MDEKIKNQWHPAFYGALHLELAENKNDLEFTEEYILNTLPLQVDTLIIKKKRVREIKNEIGKIFRTHNLIEYKSPDDSLNFNTFLKGIAYAYLYKNKEQHIDDILLEEITLTFIRERKPIKLFKVLEKRKFLVEEYRPGIYYVSKEGFLRTQIIVTKKLSAENHKWLNSLTSRLDQKKARELVDITSNLTENDDKTYAYSVWEIITAQNEEIIERMKEDQAMNEAIARIFKPELEAAYNNGQRDGFNNGFDNGFNDGIDNKGIQVFKNMIKRGFSREDAQAMAEISDELVEKAITELC